jgi:hypothetical protein
VRRLIHYLGRMAFLGSLLALLAGVVPAPADPPSRYSELYTNPKGTKDKASSMRGNPGQRESSDNQALDDMFDALGLPSKDGHLTWPLGLRILPPGPRTGPLRKQIEAAIKAAAGAAENDELAGRVLNLGRQNVRRLRRLLNENEYKFASFTTKEARHFLSDLDDAMLLLDRSERAGKKSGD